jgi:SDR family mycofactocin-dependent oxidoreductase
MAGLLEGKVAFITGAARGQGRAHAVVSAREGADIIAVDIVDQLETVNYPMSTPEDLAETVRQVEELDRRVVSITADVRSQEQLDAAVQEGIAQLGKIDILIANAGILTLAPFWELTEQQWDEMIGTNLTGVWHSAKAVAPHMMERGSGSMVLTSSINGLEPGVNYAHYVSAKFGVRGLSKNIALELAPYGIRCNSVHPGAIDTGMTRNQVGFDMMAGHADGTEEDFRNGGYSFHALKGHSMMPPEVIANAALFLNSDLAESITGVELPVDAGHMIIPGVNFSPVKE